ncbi:MAG: sulfotransferase [Thermodesulfobacteriota bacterium]|nr:sulfotransferase [Thermodesulfobacteriota bacterium]
MMQQVVFLTYLNRSGSTYLAKLLDEYSDIGVTPEARLPDGIIYSQFSLKASEDIEKILNKLYSDEKFLAWNIDRSVLEKKISTLEFPVAFNQFLGIILKEYFKNTNTKIFIYKSGHYIKHIETIRTLLPDAKFIFILRDIRACYNSQKISMDSRTKKPMETTPFFAAMSFIEVSKILDKYAQAKWMHIVKYEDLIIDENREINKLLSFLETGKRKSEGINNYFNQISKSQRHLHKNLNLEPLKERIDAWRYELSKAEILILQRIAGDILSKYGYMLVSFEKIFIIDRIYCFNYWLRYFFKNLRQKIAIRKRVELLKRHFFKRIPQRYWI